MKPAPPVTRYVLTSLRISVGHSLPPGQRDHEPERGVGVREPDDLVVDEPRGDACPDDVDVAELLPALREYRPDGAVPNEVGLEAREPVEAGLVVDRDDEHGRPPSSPRGDVGARRFELLSEVRVGHPEDRHAHARPDAELLDPALCVHE